MSMWNAIKRKAKSCIWEEKNPGTRTRCVATTRKAASSEKDIGLLLTTWWLWAINVTLWQRRPTPSWTEWGSMSSMWNVSSCLLRNDCTHLYCCAQFWLQESDGHTVANALWWTVTIVMWGQIERAGTDQSEEKRAQEDLINVYKYLTDGVKKMKLISGILSDRIRVNGHEWSMGNSVQKEENIIPVRVLKHWNGFSRVVVESLSLEVFKTRLKKFL